MLITVAIPRLIEPVRNQDSYCVMEQLRTALI